LNIIARVEASWRRMLLGWTSVEMVAENPINSLI
jgi:hypothetical protein